MPQNIKEWRVEFMKLWSRLPMDINTYRSLVDQKDFEMLESFISSLLSLQRKYDAEIARGMKFQNIKEGNDARAKFERPRKEFYNEACDSIASAILKE